MGDITVPAWAIAAVIAAAGIFGVAFRIQQWSDHRFAARQETRDLRKTVEDLLSREREEGERLTRMETLLRVIAEKMGINT